MTPNSVQCTINAYAVVNESRQGTKMYFFLIQYMHSWKVIRELGKSVWYNTYVNLWNTFT